MPWQMRWAWLITASMGLAHAGTLSVRVVDAQGKPVSDAVVTLAGASQPAAAHAASTRYIDQKNETFIPYVQVVRPGDSVVFRNSDTTRHHVYSFSPVKSFEFILRPGESSSPVVLDRAGTVAVGCNIHDHMIAYLVISPEQAQMTAQQGLVKFDALAPGHYRVQVWHPQLHPGRPQPEAQADVSSNADVSLTLSLLPDPRSFVDREHVDY
ncbi:methylamine utilization protein [Dyella subtropica]|uniref:methylamine utilization protein n=1 Tax=Dyella subtropica TaxID=2992127 RepID=UPI00224F4265|nr:methylamine utilization protein [Dyella subtropica]